MCSTFKLIDQLKKNIENMERVDAQLLADGLLNHHELNERNLSIYKLKERYIFLKAKKEAEELIILKEKT